MLLVSTYAVMNKRGFESMFRTYGMIIGQSDLDWLENFADPDLYDLDNLLNIAVQNLIEDINDKCINNVIWDYVVGDGGGFIPDEIKEKFRK